MSIARLITECSPELILGRSALCYGKAPPPQSETSIREAFSSWSTHNFLSKDRPWVYNTSSLVVDRATFMSAGGWSEDIFYQDIQDLLNKLGASGKRFLSLPRTPCGTGCIQRMRFVGSRPFLREFRCCWPRRERAYTPADAKPGSNGQPGLEDCSFTGLRKRCVAVAIAMHSFS